MSGDSDLCDGVYKSGPRAGTRCIHKGKSVTLDGNRQYCGNHIPGIEISRIRAHHYEMKQEADRVANGNKAEYDLIQIQIFQMDIRIHEMLQQKKLLEAQLYFLS